MYYYSLYIGLAHQTAPAHPPTDKRKHSSRSKARQPPTKPIDIFCSPSRAKASSCTAPFVEHARDSRNKHAGKRLQQRLQQQQSLSAWLQTFDYRFGRVQIEWWDLGASSPPDSMQPQGPVGRFEPSLACSTTYETGILRLYRCHGMYPEPDCLATRTDSCAALSVAGTSASAKDTGNVDSTETEDERPRTLAVLAVPGYMTPADFLSFTASFSDGIEHVRVVRDGSPSHYMMLLRFRALAAADEFYAYYNGKTFSPLEPETCHVVYVRRVECELQELGSDDVDRDSETICASPATLFMTPTVAPGAEGRQFSEELPTCPVCLERLDSAISGLLTTLCQHLFHCQCLAQWGDGNCPVCRYSQTAARIEREEIQQTAALCWAPEASLVASTSSANIAARDATSEQSRCHICKRTNDLWICLICGTIGCGRYANGHAKDHFEQTQHPYSMELDSQNVWDYVGDGYVHRLLQNAADRKVIALEGGRRSISDPTAVAAFDRSGVVTGVLGDEFDPTSDELSALAPSTAAAKSGRPLVLAAPRPGSLFDAREKLDAVTQEYELLLVSQLESQREHYELQLARLQHQQAQQRQQVVDLERQFSEARLKCSDLERQHDEHSGLRHQDLEQQLANAAEERKSWAAERKRLEAATAKWAKKSTEDTRLLLEEQALTRQLVDNQQQLRDQIAELKATAVDMQEQIRDLTFFISTQKALGEEQSADNELRGASIVGVAEPAPPRGKGKGKRRIQRR